jgi:HEPN domain-containing protein
MSDLTKQQLVQLADGKLEDAKLLLEQGRAESAYYLAGYAIELMLKAIVTKTILAEAIPSREFIKDILTHDFEKLVRLARLADALRSRKDEEPQFAARWQIVGEWDEQSRYQFRQPAEAEALVEAIEHVDYGVLQWLRTRL